MSEEVVPVTKFKSACLALLDKVKSTGQSILITRQGEPIALISPPPRREKRLREANDQIVNFLSWSLQMKKETGEP